MRMSDNSGLAGLKILQNLKGKTEHRNKKKELQVRIQSASYQQQNLIK